MEIVRNLILVAAVGLIAWLAFRPRPLFVLRITEGRVRVARGKVAGPFLEETRQLCEAAGVARGTIRAISTPRGILLRFSRSIPPAMQQQLRNLWILVGM